MSAKKKYFIKSTFVKCVLCLSLFTYHCTLLLAQDHVADSISAVLKTEKDDTNKVNTLKVLADRLRRTGNYDTAMTCIKSLEDLSGRLSNKKGLATAYNIKGVIYRLQGNYPKALENDFKALSVYQELGNKSGIALSLGNIGLVYWNQQNGTKALNYDFRALAIYQSLKDKKGIARNLGNIGIVYFEQHNFSQALDFDLKSLAIDQELGDKVGIAANLGDIGNVYVDLLNLPKALEYDFKALALDREIGDRDGISRNLGNIAIIYTVEKSSKLAKMYYDSALNFSKQIGEKQNIRNVYYGLVRLDTNTGNYKMALQDFKYYIIYQDSLTNEANTKKTVQTEMNFEFEQKQAAEKAEQDKKDAIALQDRKKQEVIRNSFIAGFALMLALAFFIFRGYRQKQKANEIITQQKEEVEKQKVLVEHQKALVEEKNKDILDSITYAKRLQDAILPPISIIKQYLPESFVLYKPKDIVAGDFYWLEKTGDTILVAAADCTGHGVPGALVSVVCSNALNRTVKEFKITEPGKILDKVRELVLETFEKSESNVQDGMDISLAAITAPPPPKRGNPEQAVLNPPLEGREAGGTVTVQWAGANNSLWYIQNEELKEIVPDKQPIGKTYNPKPFTTHTFTIPKVSPLGSGGAATLYLFTDGYADQFGGEKGKKFKYAQLQEKLVAISHKPLAEQKNILEQTLEEWKGNLEQVDDVLVIGIRI